MRLFLSILAVFHLLGPSTSEETYENSSNICERCKCSDAQTFTIDCSNLNLARMLAMYPSEKPKIRAIFTGNNFRQLEKLPPTDSEVEIVLSNCNIQFMDPAVFEQATNTKSVDLSHNLLTSEEVISDRFRGPFVGKRPTAIAIEDLNLGYNQIHTLYKGVFEFIPNLKRLNLEGNDFRVLDVHTQLALATVPGLTMLNLADNELTDLVAGALGNFTDLVELDLSKNDLDFVPKSLDVVAVSLQVLVLDGNPIIEVNAETFANLTNLIEISANNLTKLKHIDADTFDQTPKLERLSLCNNSALTAIDPRAFGANSTIREVHLTNNSLSSIPPSLLPWSQLDTFDFELNPLNCSCDLYTIAGALSLEIRAAAAGSSPTCADPATARPTSVYSLSGDICEAKVDAAVSVRGASQFRPISVPLLGLIVALMIACFAAIALAFSRYRRFLRGRNEQYVSQVMYSPLLTNAHSRA